MFVRNCELSARRCSAITSGRPTDRGLDLAIGAHSGAQKIQGNYCTILLHERLKAAVAKVTSARRTGLNPRISSLLLRRSLVAVGCCRIGVSPRPGTLSGTAALMPSGVAVAQQQLSRAITLVTCPGQVRKHPVPETGERWLNGVLLGKF